MTCRSRRTGSVTRPSSLPTFVDSTVLGVLAGARSRWGRDDGHIRLVISHPAVLRLFHITGLDQVFTIRPVLAEALPPP